MGRPRSVPGHLAVVRRVEPVHPRLTVLDIMMTGAWSAPRGKRHRLRRMYG